MSARSDAVYQPLRSSTSIRILRLGRDEHGRIEVDLKQVDLDQGDCPHFTTVSYVWGTAMSEQTVSINSQSSSVLETVTPLLDLLCDDPQFREDVYFWVDSVCINQTDLKEREAQVGLMDRVFRQARRTIAWLGPSNSITDEAMGFLVTLFKTRKPRFDFLHHQIRRICPELNVPHKWKSVELLFSLPWWTRAWTLQEMVLPLEVVFYCGNKSIDLRTLAYALENMWCCNPPEDLIGSTIWRRPWTRLRLASWYSSKSWRDRMSLVSLLAYSGNCEVTDPRDRIYSLLGVSRARDRELVGYPDYTLATRMIYINLVKTFIEKRKSLDIICLAHIFRATKDAQGQGTPTWVPDWSVHVAPFVTPAMVSQGSRDLMPAFSPPGRVEYYGEKFVYAAAGDSQPQFLFSEDATKITCRGVDIDRIDGLSAAEANTDMTEPQENNLIQSDSIKNQPSSYANGLEDNLGLVDAIIRCLMLDRRDRYLARPISNIAEQLRSELGGALTTTLQHTDKEMLRCFRSWAKLNESFLLKGSTLQALFKALVAPTDPNNKTYDSTSAINTNEDSFLSRFRDTTATYAMARRLFTTRKGNVGMSPSQAKKNDLVCVLFGCSVPVVLRPVTGIDDTYEFVGECYLDGYMNGEGIRQRSFVWTTNSFGWKKSREKDFTIR